MSDPSDPRDPSAQLQDLAEQVARSNPELYRHVALYLQVLRQVLPQQVRQACFHLATQVHPQRYVALPAERRRHLLVRIEQLVSRCSSLLTVEHLVILAGQISRERQRRDHHDRQELLEGRSWDEGAGVDEQAEGMLPPGSIHLSIRPPLSGDSFLWGALHGGAAVATPGGQLPEGEKADDEAHDEGDEAADAAQQGDDALHEDVEPADGQDEGAHEEALRWLQSEASQERPGPGQRAEEQSLWQPGRLPAEPDRVLAWMEGVELALARRLRNLSHAVNVELLRGGVSRTLLPVSLLDAVLAGQIETMAAPANLMRLPLPFGPTPSSHRAQAMAVLLRTVELELEEPRLRTCRRRLQQHRQEVRRMAQQYRRLQRRLRIHQAERLWLQDLRPTPDPSS